MAKRTEATEPAGVRADAMRSTVGPRVVERRCKVCEWGGERIEHDREDVDCPWCHGPTDLVRVITAPEAPAGKNPHAAALGRLGGAKGGQARAAALTAKERRAIAAKAARARWSRAKRSGS